MKTLTKLTNDGFLKTKQIENGYLPIRFHSHPTKDKEYLQTIINSNYQTETQTKTKLQMTTHLLLKDRNY